MQLTQVIDRIQPLVVTGEAADRGVSCVVFDSRKAVPGCLFVAVRGTQVDGHDYIEKAVALGAVAVVCEEIPLGADAGALEGSTSSETPSPTSSLSRGEGVCYVKVQNSAKALANIADEYHQNPSQNLSLIGITGTNGKTTVATLLHDLYTSLGYKAGLLSTVEVRIGSEVQAATHTTPDALSINALLAEMRDAGCDYVFMEVSSHAVSQHRTCGLAFNGGVFTNLSHDHLDYHKTFAAYRDAKKASSINCRKPPSLSSTPTTRTARSCCKILKPVS